jgi:CRISPR/Cas system CSM-associated protein Csm3 (group 7 of RAMP superfamily)
VHELQISLSFRMESPLHTAADRIEKGVHKSTYVREILQNHMSRLPAIPATSVKGTLRARLEYLLRKVGKQACLTQSCGDCDVCKIFGHPRKRSPLIFQDATCHGEIRIRPGVKIDRKRKVASEQHLFSLEIVDGDTFHTQITGYFDRYEDAFFACAAIWAAATFCRGFGAGRSRGLGWSRLEEFRAKIDENEVPLGKIKEKAREVLQ